MFGFGNERLRDTVREILALERAAESPPQVTVDGEALHGVVGVTVSSDPLGNPAEIDIETDGSVKRVAPCAGEDRPDDISLMHKRLESFCLPWARPSEAFAHEIVRKPANPVWDAMLAAYRAKRELPDTDDQVPAYRIERVYGGFEVQKSSRAQRRDVSLPQMTPVDWHSLYMGREVTKTRDAKPSDAKPSGKKAEAILAELALPSLWETQWDDIGDRTFKTLDKAERWLQAYVSDAQSTSYDATGVCLGDSNE